MDAHNIEVAVGPLSAMPDEHVSRAYRLLAGDVQRLLEAGNPDPLELAASRRDAELFGMEAARRGLLD
jgi:hypothetical protein